MEDGPSLPQGIGPRVPPSQVHCDPGRSIWPEYESKEPSCDGRNRKHEAETPHWLPIFIFYFYFSGERKILSLSWTFPAPELEACHFLLDSQARARGGEDRGEKKKDLKMWIKIPSSFSWAHSFAHEGFHLIISKFREFLFLLFSFLYRSHFDRF